MNNGKMECVPKCDLGTCDQASGICSGGFGGSGGEPSLVFHLNTPAEVSDAISRSTVLLAALTMRLL